MSDTPAAPADPAGLAADPRVTEALEEHLAALEGGQPADRTQLLARHPDVAGVLGEYLDGLDFLHRAVAGMHAGTGAAPPAGVPVPFLQDYEVVREVGRGGMGIVYEAAQRSLHRRVALKVLSVGATLDPRHLQRFRNEAQAAAQLQHPNIVPVFAVGCERGVHYYAMRFIDGQTLAQLIAALRGGPEEAAPAQAVTGPVRSQPTEPRGDEAFRLAARVGVQVAEALEHAHQLGVIHRDVKPANILLDNGGQVWVADFGLARWPADDALTMTGDLLGTLRYMSPEQASARRGLVDHRTDVYSLGATLYELVTLCPVFRGNDRQELLHRILNDDPVPPSRLCRAVPRDLETVLLKALGKQVEERYATAQELADDLRRFLDGKPVLARRPRAWERAGRWARRHRPVVASAALLVLTVLGLGAGIAVVGQERARAQAAYEEETRARAKEAEARAKEAEARAKEAEARARAERNFRQAQRLVDYVADAAAAGGAAEADLPNLRRKLLQAALAYYKDFIEQQSDDQLTHEELLRGYTRVASLLDAAGRRDDARVAWNQTLRIAMASQDGEAPFRLAPVRNKLRLLKLESVREDLRLTPEQERAALRLTSKEHEKAAVVREELAKLLTPEQAGRLDQLLVRQAGAWAFVDPRVSEAINLTPAQRAALAAAPKAERADNRPAGERDEGGSAERVTWVFTPDQHARWRELVGEPFPGALPPPEVTFASGAFTIRIEASRPTAGQKEASGGPPSGAAP